MISVICLLIAKTKPTDLDFPPLICYSFAVQVKSWRSHDLERKPMREMYEEQSKKELLEMARFLESLKGDDAHWRQKLEEKIESLKSKIDAVTGSGPVEPGGISHFSDPFWVHTLRLLLRRPSAPEKDLFLAVKKAIPIIRECTKSKKCGMICGTSTWAMKRCMPP